ncbi:MAG: protein tyrosine phosphatase family protein, partial [Stenotrophobium sp.]
DTAGQPQAGHFAALAQAGYDAVINLAVPASSNFLTNESQLCAQNNLRYTHIPVEWKNPTRKNLEEFFALMESLKERKVFVHCALNMRVSAFVFLHRVIRLAETPEVAMKDLRRIWQPDEVWSAFIERMLRESRQA